MDDESVFPERENMQEGDDVQGEQRIWRQSSRTGFVYSRERVNKLDVRSLDRVWERLEEHVARNSAAYQANNNVPALRTPAAVPAIQRKQQAHPRKHHAFRRRLNMFAAACILLLLVGSLLAVFYTVRHIGGSTITGSHGQLTPSSPLVGGKISIVEGKNGVEFYPLNIKVSAGASILLSNNTSEIQVVVLDDNSKPVTLAPKASALVPVGDAGKYSWHLKPYPSAQVNLYVFSSAAPMVTPANNMVTLVPSKVGNGIEFAPGKLVIKAGMAIVWMNGTAQTQVIVGDSDGEKIPLAAKGGSKTVFSKAGTYIFHLESAAGAQLVVLVEN